MVQHLVPISGFSLRSLPFSASSGMLVLVHNLSSSRGKQDAAEEDPPEDNAAQLAFDVAVVVRAITRLAAAQTK
eukprot:2167260-Amphidinium_carterae.1